MIEQIAKTDFYEISVDKAKNRWFLTAKGQWEQTAPLQNYLKDCDKAMSLLTPGFTLLADMTQQANMSQHAVSLSVALGGRVIALGAKKMATILPTALLNAQMEKVKEQVKMKSTNFGTRAEAEAWLDQA